MDENHQDKTESKTPAAEDKTVKITEEYAPDGSLTKKTKEYPPKKTRSDWVAWSTQVVGPILVAAAVIVSIVSLREGVNQFKEQQSNSANTLATQVAAGAQQTLDQQRQTTLDTFFASMQELLLQKADDFKAYKPGDQYQAIAVARIFTALRNLDGPRKGYLIRFLWGAQLINAPNPILHAEGADLSGAVFSVPNKHVNLSEVSLVNDFLDGANLSGADLQKADLSGADLSNANLTGAYLSEARLNNANLSKAHLSKACLGSTDICGKKLPLTSAAVKFPLSQSTPTTSSPHLSGADLSGADLSGAFVNTNQLDEASILTGATLPDGSTHP